MAEFRSNVTTAVPDSTSVAGGEMFMVTFTVDQGGGTVQFAVDNGGGYVTPTSGTMHFDPCQTQRQVMFTTTDPNVPLFATVKAKAVQAADWQASCGVTVDIDLMDDPEEV